MQSILEALTHQIIAPAIKKKWFSEPFLPFRRYLAVYEEAFEMGVALGYVHRDNLPSLAELFSEEGRENELVNALREVAQRRLLESPSAVSFLDLGMFAEEARVKAEIRSRSPAFDFFSTNMTDDEIWEMPKKLAKIESAVDRAADKLDIPVPVAFRNLQTMMSVGIGLGGAFPKKSEEFWTHQYERPISESEVVKWRAAGLKIPASIPNSITLARYGEQMRSVAEEFIFKYRPIRLSQIIRTKS